jgi:hypothetical protein
MNMVDLILRVCLAAQPSNCRDEHLLFESRGSLFQCMILAPTEIAKWSAQHPALKIIRWKCAAPDGSQRI